MPTKKPKLKTSPVYNVKPVKGGYRVFYGNKPIAAWTSDTKSIVDAIVKPANALLKKKRQKEHLAAIRKSK
jgi:hypothetical protein